MFSNQYMGTRPASRSLPRVSSHNSYQDSGPYSRPVIAQRPVNARCDEDDDNEVDYSFMNLPVRERRKLFLSGGAPIEVQRGYGTFMSMPRNRNPAYVPQRCYETQSEYGGGGDFDGHSPNWARGSFRGASNCSSQRSRSSKTFSLIPANRNSACTTNTLVNHNRNSDIHIINESEHSPRPCSPRHINDTYLNTNAVRIMTVPPPRQRYREVSPCPTVAHCAPAVRISSRNATPLRVNVYNSDHVSPRNSHAWATPSPVYPAYPACKERTTIIEVPTPRFRREQSAKPVTICPTRAQKYHSLDPRPTCKPCHPHSSHSNHRSHGFYDQVGVSDF